MPEANPRLINTSIANSRRQCPADTSGPTRHPWRGASVMIAADTGSGETTAPRDIRNEKLKMGKKP